MDAHPANRLLTAGAPEYRLVAWLFVRLLALIYLAAFASLGVQILGLAGEAGIYPLTEQLAQSGEAHGALRLLAVPSLFWLWGGDTALLAATWGGCLLALGLLAGLWPRTLLVLLYLLYLSLYHAGQVFTNFQWDYLLLETGFLAILLPGGSRLAVWLFRWLLFRLRFLSGLSKLLSGDPTWIGLTALTHYFETQPLPHPGAWYAHQLPEWLLAAGTAGTLVVELIVPFLMFLPRRWRFLAAWLTILWQVLIIATSNHNFFNLLTIVLCLFLFDDRALARVVPAAWTRHAGASALLPDRPRRSVATAAVAVALVVVPASLVSAAELLRGGQVPVASAWLDWVEPWRIANRYHVFPKVETERIEVQVEASADGKRWEPLDFRYRPDDPAEAPAFIVPHQPRLDWMLWFVPKSPFFLDVFERFLSAVLDRSPAVTDLLARPPAGGSPTMLRVNVYRYRFSTREERTATGLWWQRESLGPFFPLPFLAVEAAELKGD